METTIECVTCSFGKAAAKQAGAKTTCNVTCVGWQRRYWQNVRKQKHISRLNPKCGNQKGLDHYKNTEAKTRSSISGQVSTVRLHNEQYRNVSWPQHQLRLSYTKVSSRPRRSDWRLEKNPGAHTTFGKG